MEDMNITENTMEDNVSVNCIPEGKVVAETISFSNEEFVIETDKREEFPQFKKFIVACLLYAITFTFCRFRNKTGLLTSMDYLATVIFLFYIFNLFKYKIKPGFIFSMTAYVLLGVHICTTTDGNIIIFDRIGGILVLFTGIIHECYNDKDWGYLKYFAALNQFFFGAAMHIFDPVFDWNANKNKTGKNKNIRYVLLGLIIALPLLLIIIPLLSSADIMFAKIFKNFFKKIYFKDIILILLMATATFVSAYALLKKITRHDISEKVKERKKANYIVGITFNSILSFVYIVFSGYQFVFLFLGVGLPDGYTYAQYAHEGFYQLVAVSVINLLIVFISKVVFDDNKVLKAILLIISLCTFIMIASSMYRMILYIGVYQLTYLRLLTLWALAVITLIMAVICVYIFAPRIPVVKIMVGTVIVLYLVLAYSYPERIITKYNMKEFLRTGKGDLMYIANCEECVDAFEYADRYYENCLNEKDTEKYIEAKMYFLKQYRLLKYHDFSFRQCNFESEKIRKYVMSNQYDVY